MERRNGGDQLAPPRPPKLLPGIHRPRAPEPPMMSAPLQQQQQHQNQQQQQHQQLQQQQRVTTQQTQQQLLHPPPTTAPLAPLQPISFSRRRPPLTANLPSPSPSPIIPSLSSNIYNLDNIESQISPVTLALPRPDNERLTNEYVDTPFRLPHSVVASRTQTEFTTTPLSTTSGVLSTTTTGSPKPFIHNNNNNNSLLVLSSSSSSTPSSTTTTTATTIPGTTILSSAATTTTTTTQRQQRPTALSLSAITKQPNSIFSKDIPSSVLHEEIDLHPTLNGDLINSITCPECQKCRCEECQRPRQLPSRWVCDNTCLCSAETVIDYISCLCCVKALYYHCSKDHEMDRDGDNISCADDPCSCVSYNCKTRWSCLGALSILLPCLLCYWPMRGCVAICANCYARHSRHGCRCPDNNKLSIHSNQQMMIQQQQQTSVMQQQQQQNHHHHHQGTIQIGRNNTRTNNELTPEKRLLDSSPEF